MGDVAERTPKDALYTQVVGEIAEVVRKEVPTRERPLTDASGRVFFLQESDDGSLELWVGAGTSEATFKAIRKSRILPDQPIDLSVDGIPTPFRVVSILIEDGSRIYLGLSEEEEIQTLNDLRLEFLSLWLIMVLFGFMLIFSISRGLLKHIQRITDAASRIGRSDLKTRVPIASRKDEVAHLAVTLNNMLDRIENSMQQLHSMSDSLAHDIRSPITAVRGKLETSLTARSTEELTESVVSSIEVLDRLSHFLTESLDVAEANADALRLNRSEIDLEEVLLSMINLYDPGMTEKGLKLSFNSRGSVKIHADPALINRLISNLFDNEMTHLPPESLITIALGVEGDFAKLTVEDNGPGFDPDLIDDIFERQKRGKQSTGRGLGLAFVQAVVRAHGGTIRAQNRETGGARISIALPLGYKVSASDSTANSAVADLA